MAVNGILLGKSDSFSTIEKYIVTEFSLSSDSIYIGRIDWTEDILNNYDFISFFLEGTAIQGSEYYGYLRISNSEYNNKTIMTLERNVKVTNFRQLFQIRSRTKNSSYYIAQIANGEDVVTTLRTDSPSQLKFSSKGVYSGKLIVSAIKIF